MSRFGSFTQSLIDENIEKSIPSNTKKNKSFVWKQFMEFCLSRGYSFQQDTPVVQLALILKDWGFNMRKLDGEDYKESTVKTIWNLTAKMMMDHYFEKYKIKINPFEQHEFKSAREARDSKRRDLQKQENKRKVSSAFLKYDELKLLVDSCDENTPEGLQKKLFFVLSYELAWRGGEGVTAQKCFFKEELNSIGQKTGRIEYNPIFTKTAQGGSKQCASSKWLVMNKNNRELCPVRLFSLFTTKREDIKSERLFLTVNQYWKSNQRWYKNTPVGKNEIAKWTTRQADKVGLDVKNRKITNHSLRATAVSKLAKSGVSDQELIKITGHASSKSIVPYLQMDHEHHQAIIDKMRSESGPSLQDQSPSRSSNSTCTNSSSKSNQNCQYIINYNNCNINYNN